MEWTWDDRVTLTPRGIFVLSLPSSAECEQEFAEAASVGFDMLLCSVCSAPIRPKLVYETGREWILCNDCAARRLASLRGE